MTKPIELIESNTLQVVIIVDRMDKTYKVTATKRRDSDYIEATIEFPVEDGLVASVGRTTQVKCSKGSILIEQFSVSDTTPIGYILKYGIKRAYTAVSEANENCRIERLKERTERNKYAKN